MENKILEKKTVEYLPDTFAKTSQNLIGGVVSLYLVAVMILLPLIYDNFYFNILETKYRCFLICTITFFLVMAGLALILFFVDQKEYQGIHRKLLFSKHSLRVPDAALLIFWLAAVVSTIQSEYRYEAFWGNEGRYSGLFLISLYVIVYILVSRFWRWKA